MPLENAVCDEAPNHRLIRLNVMFLPFQYQRSSHISCAVLVAVVLLQLRNLLRLLLLSFRGLRLLRRCRY
jgi:hypothetical protein